MKKTGMIIFTFCLLFISCRPLINPIDPKSDDYIGYESIDNDGDGTGQYYDVDEIESVSPEDGAFFTRTTTPTLKVNKMDPDTVSAYQFQIDTDSGFPEPVFYENNEVSTHAFSVPPGTLENNTTYYWRAKAFDGTKWSDEWTEVRSFSINIDTNVPIEPFPVNGGATDDTTPLLEWINVPTALSYEVEISTSEDFVNDLIDSANGLVDSEYQMTEVLSNNTTYYWRVRIYIEGDIAGQWSETWSFTVDMEEPENPVPTNGSTTEDTTPELEWDDVTSADRYEIQINTVDDFSTTLETAGGLVSSEYQMTEVLSNNTTYYWRVRIRDENNVAGDWSNTWSFTVDMEEPENPVPTDGGTTEDITPLLEWDDVTSAASYEVEISTDAGFFDIVESADGFSISEYQMTVELTDTTYYWRVNIHDENDVVGDWSDTWSFTVNVPLGVPTNPVPPDSSSTIDTTPLLNWDDVTSADSYEIQINTVDDFSTTLETGIGLASSEYQMTEILANNTTYYWRVRAYNEYDVPGEWSDTWSFTVDMEEPVNPSPADLGTTADTTLLLEWDDVTSADSYEIEISTDAGFSTIIETDSEFVSSEYQMTEILANNTTYYWQVRIRDENNVAGDWSDTWSFTVDMEEPENPVPTDLGTTADTTPLLEWDDVLSAASYDVEISAASDFSTTLETAGGLLSSEYQMTEILANNTTYYWRVRIYNSDSVAGDWSSWSFTVNTGGP